MGVHVIPSGLINTCLEKGQSGAASKLVLPFETRPQVPTPMPCGRPSRNFTCKSERPYNGYSTNSCKKQAKNAKRNQTK